MVHLTIDGIFFDSVKYDVYFANMGDAFDVQGYTQNHIILVSEMARYHFFHQLYLLNTKTFHGI